MVGLLSSVLVWITRTSSSTLINIVLIGSGLTPLYFPKASRLTRVCLISMAIEIHHIGYPIVACVVIIRTFPGHLNMTRR
ncbi:hypothetical protein EDB19DRAFT_1712540 [Suillus lakei]|nr:hypothetical protein EDB19DRAFT_1712540 [Suillus lakei]